MNSIVKKDLENAWNAFDVWRNNSSKSIKESSVKPNTRYSSKHCYYCKKGWAKGRTRTRQHLLPKRRGGLYESENLRWCCDLCNGLLDMVDDCPAMYMAYRAIIEDSPLKYLPLKTGFQVLISIKNDNYGKRVNDLVTKLIDQLNHDKNKYTARKILRYLAKSFPGMIRNNLSKNEILVIFKSN